MYFGDLKKAIEERDYTFDLADDRSKLEILDSKGKSIDRPEASSYYCINLWPSDEDACNYPHLELRTHYLDRSLFGGKDSRTLDDKATIGDSFLREIPLGDEFYSMSHVDFIELMEKNPVLFRQFNFIRDGLTPRVLLSEQESDILPKKGRPYIIIPQNASPNKISESITGMIQLYQKWDQLIDHLAKQVIDEAGIQ